MIVMNSSEGHDYIERCPFCQKFMTAKQVKTHQCDAHPFSSVKEIPVLYYYEVPEGNEKVIIAHGYDGIMYRLIECKNPLAHKSSSDDGYHDRSNRRKVNRTKTCSIFI
jgi:hypothetical protein